MAIAMGRRFEEYNVRWFEEPVPPEMVEAIRGHLDGLARPAHQLLQQAEAAQLLVVGSRGRGGFEGMLLGSVSSEVVQSARMPVIVARGG